MASEKVSTVRYHKNTLMGLGSCWLCSGLRRFGVCLLGAIIVLSLVTTGRFYLKFLAPKIQFCSSKSSRQQSFYICAEMRLFCHL